MIIMMAVRMIRTEKSTVVPIFVSAWKGKAQTIIIQSTAPRIEPNLRSNGIYLFMGKSRMAATKMKIIVMRMSNPASCAVEDDAMVAKEIKKMKRSGRNHLNGRHKGAASGLDGLGIIICAVYLTHSKWHRPVTCES